MKENLSNWIPVAFCAALSLISASAFSQSTSGTAGVISFVCFLPMCFVFVAMTTARLQREIRDLREQLSKLQQTS
ncbi:MAG: hypothetical protein ABSE59_10975 [Opitutaceae bacterium]|jgi:hypothetical protein